MERRVVVVGGGVIGLFAAYYASRRGLRVTVLERGGPEDQGCSLGNAGMIVPSHIVPLAAPGMPLEGLRHLLNAEGPFYLKPRLSRDLASWCARFWRSSTARHVVRSAPLLRDLHLTSRACYEELEQAGFAFGLSREGLLMLCRSEAGLDEEARAAARARSLGIPANVLTPAEVRALEPGARLDVAGAVHYPLDCHLTPAELMTALRQELERASVPIVWHTSVSGWRVRGGRIDAVRTSTGELEADEYVLAAGVWSMRIARDLGFALPMEAGKGYSLTLARPARRLVHCAILAEAHVAVTPMGESMRFGGTLEFAGLDSRINPARVRGIVAAVPRYLPDFSAEDFAGQDAWCGLRPCSPDGLPYVGRSSRLANLTIGTGHAMMGVSLGPVTGRLLAELLCHEPPSIDISMLSPDRWS